MGFSESRAYGVWAVAGLGLKSSGFTLLEGSTLISESFHTNTAQLLRHSALSCIGAVLHNSELTK